MSNGKASFKAKTSGKLKTVAIREAALQELIITKKKAIQKAPGGRLELATMRGVPHFYHLTFEDEDRSKQKKVYLGQKDLGKVRALAQKSYDQKVLRVAEQELKAWNMLAKFFPSMTVEEVYETLSPARRKFVTPVIPTDEEFRKQWESVVYEPGYFKDGAAVFMTDRGERVRSKSEQLIANLLYRLGIPYRYEYPIEVMVDGKKRIWRPDFTILDVRNRREVYLEHFGLLDDQNDRDNYARNAFWKMKIYEENGHFDGGDMIFSFETSRAPLDITYVEQKVRRALSMPPMQQSYIGMSFPPARW